MLAFLSIWQMKIAQVSPLIESTPPRSYGGIERVVAYLTDELTHMGHEVTLFATADSSAQASRLVPCAETGLRGSNAIDPVARHVAMLETVVQMADEFDIIHFHLDYLHLPLARALAWPHITTLHGRLDRADHQLLYCRFPEVPLVSISDSQRKPLSSVNWRATVYNGIPERTGTLPTQKREYLAFMGRIAPEKGVIDAIHIARKAGLPLRIAAKVDREWASYFRESVEPLMRASNVTFLGEIGESAKDDFLGGAFALLFPIDWPEPFGLVMVEAMARGTPVIAYSRGAVPEVLDEGMSGFLVDSVESAVAAVHKLDRIDHHRCRQLFESRFTARRMATDYLEVYRQILKDRSASVARSPVNF